MNTSPCCEECKRFDDFNKNIEAGTAETYCANPSCPCHQPQDFREILRLLLEKNIAVDGGAVATKYFHEIEILIESVIVNTETRCAQISAKLIQNAKEKSYEEGRTGSIQDAGYMQGEEYHKGVKAGRAALIAELLAEWPKKKEMEVRELGKYAGKVDPGMVQNIGIKGYNEGVEIGRAIIESKKHEKS